MRRGEGEEEIDIKKKLKKINLELRRGGAAAENRLAAAPQTPLLHLRPNRF